jgi:hypothetical protein
MDAVRSTTCAPNAQAAVIITQPIRIFVKIPSSSRWTHHDYPSITSAEHLSNEIHFILMLKDNKKYVS